MIKYIKITCEALIIGVIFLIFGIILFDLTINKNNVKTSKPFGLNLAFFATGFFMYVIYEIIINMINV